MWQTAIMHLIREKICKILFKLLTSPENSFLYFSYEIQLQLDTLYERGWVTNLKRILFSNGFGHVWISQRVGNERIHVNALGYCHAKLESKIGELIWRAAPNS